MRIACPSAHRPGPPPWQTPASWVLLLLTLGYAASAEAHIRAGEAGGFLSGLKHPVSGLDHIVAMVSVGLWGAQLGRPAIWVLPVTFPLVMAVGGFLGLVGIPVPGAEVGIAASAIVLGAMVLLEARPPLAAAAVLVATFAIFHGYAHGVELPPGGNGLLYSLGFIMATGFLHGCGIVLGLVHRWPWGQVTLRTAGGLVLATGGVFLWKTLV
jgi:urease accessory protein